jgi:hypothetical protein
MITDNELIMVAIELGYTYCEKGYPLEEAKRDTLRQLQMHKRERAANEGNGNDPKRS